MSAIGVTIVFSSIEIDILQYKTFPPYGIITEGLMPIGAYYSLIGIFTLAGSISQDIEIRKELHKSAVSQSNLLKTIGTVQMENELIKTCKTIAKKVKLDEMQDNKGLDEEEIVDLKEMVREVVDELERNKEALTKRR